MDAYTFPLGISRVATHASPAKALTASTYGCRYISLDDLEGRLVAVVCNLKPAKLKGVESAGMVLAAGTDTVSERTSAGLSRVISI